MPWALDPPLSIEAPAITPASVPQIGNIMSPTSALSVLATPEQLASERLLLRLIDDSDIQAVQEELRAGLAQTPLGRDGVGADRLMNAIKMWTQSLIMLETATHQPVPAFIWATDDTPHQWHGVSFPGSGIAGDNPDAAYRILTLNGSKDTVITGQIDMENRPSETTIDVTRGDLIPQSALENQTTDHADMGLQLSFTNDREFSVGPEGHFRLTAGVNGEGPNHLKTAHQTVTILIREMLSDWNQRPAILAIEQAPSTEAITATPRSDALKSYAEVKSAVLAKLRSYVGFWSDYNGNFLGGLGANELGGPAARDGGWGYIAAIRFKLAADEAMIIETSDAGADYTGIQISDPWMITPDASQNLISRNKAQATADASGNITYVVSAVDSGHPNWVDTAGLAEGFILLRWQAMPSTADKDALLHGYRIVRHSALSAVAGHGSISPQQRSDEQADRKRAFESRYR